MSETPEILAAETAEYTETSRGRDSADSAVSAASPGLAEQTAGRAGRVLAYWRWKKISALLEAAGQLALFDGADRNVGVDEIEAAEVCDER